MHVAPDNVEAEDAFLFLLLSSPPTPPEDIVQLCMLEQPGRGPLFVNANARDDESSRGGAADTAHVPR